MPKRVYSPGERAEALARLRANQGNVGRTAAELGIPEQSLRDWRAAVERATDGATDGSAAGPGAVMIEDDPGATDGADDSPKPPGADPGGPAMNIHHERLQRLSTDVFAAAGCRPAEAERVSRHLVEANLVGHDSHGVIRISAYLRWLKAGQVLADRTLHVAFENEAIAVVDDHVFQRAAACREAGPAAQRKAGHADAELGVDRIVDAGGADALGNVHPRPGGPRLPGPVEVGVLRGRKDSDYLGVRHD